MAAARASDEVTDEPTTAPIGRVLNRRKATAPPVPDEPVVVYELEGDDDDADADWVPPAWVSAAARERAANPAARAGTTRGRPNRSPS